MREHRREVSVAVSIVVLCAFLLYAAPGFFSVSNLFDLLLANIPVLIIAIGMTLVILTANIDISVGSQFALCAVASGMIAKSGLPMAAMVGCVVLLGGVMGAVNGLLVGKMQIPSIVVTLAMMVALRDALRWYTEGAWVQDLPRGYQWFGLSQTGSAVVTVSVAALVIAIAAWTLRHVGAGRLIYATGSNAEAVRLAGVEPSSVVLLVFVTIGVLTACAAILNSVRFNQIPSNAGIGLELKVIAAVVVGGASINGGRGTILGTVLGVVLLGMIGPALTFVGINAYWERAIQGVIILGAVAADSPRFHFDKYGSLAAARS